MQRGTYNSRINKMITTGSRCRQLTPYLHKIARLSFLMKGEKMKNKKTKEIEAEQYAHITIGSCVDDIIDEITPIIEKRVWSDIEWAYKVGGEKSRLLNNYKEEEITVVCDRNGIIIDRLPGNVSINAADYEGEAYPLTVVVYKQTNKMKYEK